MPASRFRASSIELRLGAVVAVNVKYLLKYLPHGRQRVKFAALNLVQEPLELRIA